MLSKDVSEKASELKEQAEQGNVRAMHEYAVTCDDHGERDYWLQKAVQETYMPAIYEFAVRCDDSAERRR